MNAERIKVLFVAPSLSGGGAERFVSTLATHLNRDRFQVSICLMRDNRTYEVPPDVSITVLHKRKFWHLPRTILRLRRLITAERPDVVIGTITFTNWLIAAAVHGITPRPRCIARFGNNPYREYGRFYYASWRFVVERMLKRFDAYVANSEELANLVSNCYPTASPCQTIRNPIDFDRIEEAARDRMALGHQDCELTLVAMGRLVQQKRLDLLIDAFSSVCRDRNVKLIIIGDGPLRPRLQKRISTLELNNHIQIQGFVSNPYPTLNGADIFVMTSEFEGMPNALAEAQGLGLPAIATRCATGPSEIIVDGETGFLVPVNDAVELEAKLARLIDDTGLRRQMSSKAKEKARGLFDCEQQVKAWGKLLSNVL